MIAVIDWSSAAPLKENAQLFRRAGEEGRVRPREWRDGAVKYRSLTVWEDGTCELQRFSTAAVVRRLEGEIVQRTARKVRVEQRGGA